MITLSFLKYLEDHNFGTIDESLFYQKLTLDRNGIYIADIGGPAAKGSRDVQSYELLARGGDDIEGVKKLTEIRRHLIQNYSDICSLPDVPDPDSDSGDLITEGYSNVTITKPSTITNVGLDDNNRVIYSITGTIIYKEK